MANPQKENGYTSIANELLEALCRTRISGEARQVLDTIIRKTYGYNKRTDIISLSQFCEMTKMPKSSVARGLRYLKSRMVIKFVPHGYATEYEVNKNYDEWEKVFAYDRLKIFKRDGYMCQICHSVKTAQELEVDHIVPLWLNGANKEENLATSCTKCNRTKGAERLRYKSHVTELSQGQKEDETCDNSASKPVTALSQTKDSIQKTIQKTDKNASAFLEGEQWNELIDSFEPVNPMYTSFYRMKTQRAALQEIVKAIGYEKTLWLIRHLRQATSKPYAPRITKPTQLRDKLGELQTFWEQEKQKLNITSNKGRGLA